MSRRFRAILAVSMVMSAAAPGARQAQWQDVIRNLRHPKADVRLESVERLNEAGYVGAIEPVAALIGDPDDRVQAAAIDAELTFFLTERIGGSGRLLSMGSSKSRAQLAFEAGPLVRTATPAPPALVAALTAAMRDENARVRFDAVHALGFIAEPPLTPAQIQGIVDGLDHYDPLIRIGTARVLGRLGAREAGSKLFDTLSDSNATVRQYAIEAVGQVREARAMAFLRDAIERGSGNVDVLLLALARIGSPMDLALFREHLRDRRPEARRAAVEGLGRLGDTESTGAITNVLQADRAETVRLAAAFALQRLGQTQTHTIAAMLVLDSVREQARDYLFELGGAALPGIESALKVATDSRHRADLIQLIGYFGTGESMPSMERYLTDKDERVVRAATNATLRLRRQ